MELYNLAEDVGETKNLVTARADIARKLEALLTAVRIDSPDFPLSGRQKKKGK